jgi:hypothetical protein
MSNDDEIPNHLLRRSQDCRSRAETALSPEERARWTEMADYFLDLSKRWTMSDSKKT